MTPDLHWHMADPSDLDEDPWDTPGSVADADLAYQCDVDERVRDLDERGRE